MKRLRCDAVLINCTSVGCVFNPNYDEQAHHGDASNSQRQRHFWSSSILSDTDSSGEKKILRTLICIAQVTGKVSDRVFRLFFADGSHRGDIRRFRFECPDLRATELLLGSLCCSVPNSSSSCRLSSRPGVADVANTQRVNHSKSPGLELHETRATLHLDCS